MYRYFIGTDIHSNIGDIELEVKPYIWDDLSVCVCVCELRINTYTAKSANSK